MESIRNTEPINEARYFALYDLAARPREAVRDARAWLLDCEWAEGEDAVEEIQVLNALGIIMAVERHYDGGWKAFLRDGAAL